jgi:hypothetical protein
MRGHFRTTSVVVALIDDGDASRRTFMRFHTLYALPSTARNCPPCALLGIYQACHSSRLTRGPRL